MELFRHLRQSYGVSLIAFLVAAAALIAMFGYLAVMKISQTNTLVRLEPVVNQEYEERDVKNDGHGTAERRGEVNDQALYTFPDEIDDFWSLEAACGDDDLGFHTDLEELPAHTSADQGLLQGLDTYPVRPYHAYQYPHNIDDFDFLTEFRDGEP